MTANSSNTGDLVRLESISKVYRTAPADRRPALAGITLSLPEGGFTVISGPAGSGKSTLLGCAAGVIRPTSGSVMLDGVKLDRLDQAGLTALRRDRIGFLGRDPRLCPGLTVWRNAVLPASLAGREPDRPAVERVLDQTGLAGLAYAYPAGLTPGECRRVALARALLAGAKVIFADDPAAGLDPADAREVLRRLRDCGRTVILATTNPSGLADRSVFLDGGRLTEIPAVRN